MQTLQISASGLGLQCLSTFHLGAYITLCVNDFNKLMLLMIHFMSKMHVEQQTD